MERRFHVIITSDTDCSTHTDWFPNEYDIMPFITNFFENEFDHVDPANEYICAVIDLQENTIRRVKVTEQPRKIIVKYE